jgi:hypothetical protein
MKTVNACVLTVLFILTAATRAPAVESKHQAKPWKITGQLEEACTCDGACPCWFDSKPTKSSCGGHQVLFIEKGKYGRVSLAGLAIANAVQSPEGQTMMGSFGKWNFSYLYVDEKATPEQREALEEIGKVVLPYSGSPKTKIRVVPITRTIHGKEHQIAIGKVGTFHGHLVEGGLGGAPRIVNPPGADPIHHEYRQGKTTRFTYRDAGQNWNTKDSNYMLGTFTVDSDQYAKFSAGLAQKMAGMKR